MRRLLGILFAGIAQVAFIATVPVLYRFLRNDFSAKPGGMLWLDGLLAIQFAIPHSLALHPRIRSFPAKLIGSGLYGCFYCLLTCLNLWILFALWRGSDVIVWEWPEHLKTFVGWAFIGSWGALLYSLSLTGLGYQTGLTQWWHWVRGRPMPRRKFRPVGAYRWMRHPVYLSFLGLVWLTPVITADRAVLMAAWTVYVLVGSHLKDERLIFYLRDEYREYASRVRGFPFVYWGPLGLRHSVNDTSEIIPLSVEYPRKAA